MGRTARAGKVGKSLLFLLESELGFLRYLKDAKVPLNEYTFPADRIANVQTQVRPDSMTDRLDFDTTYNLVGETVTKELLSASIGKRWVQVLSSGVCLLFTQENIRHQCVGSCQGRKVVRVCCSTSYQHQHRWWKWQIECGEKATTERGGGGGSVGGYAAWGGCGEW